MYLARATVKDSCTTQCTVGPFSKQWKHTNNGVPGYRLTYNTRGLEQQMDGIG